MVSRTTAAIIGVLLCAAMTQQSSDSTPPVARLGPVIDDYYGTKIVDPYRYLENLGDSDVQSWMKAQNDYTRSALAAIPGRQKLLARIRELDQSLTRVSAERLPGDTYIILKRLPSEDVDKLYWRRGLNGADKLLVDPEKVKLAAAIKGKNTISYFVPSQDGRYVAVGIVPGGSPQNTEMHIFETNSGRETGDVIGRTWSPLGPSWLPDNHSFVYGKLQNRSAAAPATEELQNIRSYLHVLGTDSARDPAVFGSDVVPWITVDPRFPATVEVQPGSDYAIGAVRAGGSDSFYIGPVTGLGKSNSAWRKVADSSDKVRDIRVHGHDLYLLTYRNAARYKVLRTDVRQPDLASAETIVPSTKAVVRWMYLAQDGFYVRLMDGGIDRVLRVPYGPHPQIQELDLPIKGSAFVNTDPRIPGALLYLTSWTRATKIYAYDPRTNRATDTKLQPTAAYDDPEDIDSIEIKIPSYDGTPVPLSIMYPKKIKLDGSNPTLLEGYGAYGSTNPPHLELLRLAWYREGGVYAVCHVRGGGEYGEEWHMAGMKATKPNTWRDFIACAQYLIEKKYTSPAHLAGQGFSGGGILIGRAITERPDLFGAAIDEAGCSDMLRFETEPNGVPNASEFGTTKTKDGFEALYAMSAYHHIKDGTPYPAVLLRTGLNDPIVSPWHMLKMTARLQAATTSRKPVLLRVEYGAGHGDLGGTQRQQQEWFADEWSFLLWQFGVPEFQPKP